MLKVFHICPLILSMTAIAVMPSTAVAAADQTARNSSLMTLVQMQGVDGEAHGTVSLKQISGGVLLTARLKNLPAGTHGFHLHQNANCTPSFQAAGGHFNPTKKAHGFLAANGPHMGDMPNIHVPASGDLTIEIYLSALRLDDPAAMPGTVMIHQGADDYISQPSGASGSRIACGEIKRN